MKTKKGQLGNMVDFLYIIVVGLMIVLIISVNLYGFSDSRQKKALSEIAEVERISAGIMNLRLRLNNGENIAALNVNEEISKSQILKGRVIHGCKDYINPQDCNNDALNLYKISIDESYCFWAEGEKSCLTGFRKSELK